MDDHPLSASIAAVSLPACLWAAAGIDHAVEVWGQGPDARQATIRGFTILAMIYVSLVLVLWAAHRRIRRRGIGDGAVHPSLAALVSVGVGIGAIIYRNGTLVDAAAFGVVAMALFWVAHVVVRSMVGTRRLLVNGSDSVQAALGSEPGRKAESTTDNQSPSWGPPASAGAAVIRRPRNVPGAVTAAIIAGLSALTIAIAKSTHAWWAFPVFLLIPTFVLWTSRRAKLVASRLHPSATSSAAVEGDEVADEERHENAAPVKAEDATLLDAPLHVPRQLRVRSRARLVWAAIFLAMGLGMIYAFVTPSSTFDAGAFIIGGSLSILGLFLFLIFVQLGIVADEEALVLTNAFKQIRIPWSQLDDIEFAPADGSLISGILYGMVLVTREPRSFGVEFLTGSASPGTYLDDARRNLLAMRDVYAPASSRW
jgi:hypothetical protein